MAVFALFFLGYSLPASQSATNLSNTKCSTLGTTIKSQKVVYRCELKSSGFYWVKLPGKKVPAKASQANWFKQFASHGLLVESCQSSGVINLEVNDPNTGMVIAEHNHESIIHDANLGELHIDLCDSSLTQDATTNFFARQQFSLDSSKITFTSQSQPDGSVHVGYIDIASNKIVDVTSFSETSGFSAIVPIDWSPIFDPDNGKFCFLRAAAAPSQIFGGTGPSNLHCYDINLQTDSILGAIPDDNAPNITQDYLTSQHGILVSGDLLVSPVSGTYAFPSSIYGGQVDFGATAPFISDSSVDILNFQDNSMILNGPFGEGFVTLDGWIINDLLLMELPGFSGIYTAASSTSAQISVDPHDLLPSISAKNSNVVLSPDGVQLAFIHSLGNNTDLYKSSTSGLGSPTNVKLISISI